jgi:AcrR family transcriptional regulator
MARTGRRPGRADTRGEILGAARAQFADRGFRGATIRGIAARAGVDPALVHHYFGSKRDLFIETLELPFDPTTVVAAAADGDPAEAGERIIRTLLGVWATDRGRAMTQSVLRSALSDDELLAILREFMFETVVLPIVTAVASDQVPLRATLVSSQVIGLAFVRHVAEVEPLASADPDTVVAAIAPTLQRYLTGELAGA